jgi:hypothetical protein
MTRKLLGALVSAVLAALALGACNSDGGSGEASSGSPASSSESSTVAAIPCGTYTGRGCAPQTRRVDLARPSFSNPTSITNPLFPISRLHSAVLLGHVDGKPFRTETTLLPGSKTVAWNGQEVETLISQYVAYLDRRIEEVALDRYAQADDGSVWYFGEDVFDYRNGAVAMTEGTWRAGRDGPAAMIMPAAPRVGDAFRTENIPGVVFEEVEVKSVGRRVDGPRGPLEGAMVGEELHSDGTHEDKLFAPGYGEFRTSGGGDLEALALAVPTDALSGPPPAELNSLSTSAGGVLESARVREWQAAAATVDRMKAAWSNLPTRKQPRMVAARLSAALSGLARAVRARRAAPTAQAAIDVAQSTLDLKLRHLPPAAIDAARFDLRTQQLRVDAAAHDLAGVTGDVAVLEWIRDRIAQTLSPSARSEVDARLRALRIATDAGNLPAAADHAARLAARLRDLAAPRHAD